MVVHDGHSGPKEIGVGPEFLAWLTDPRLDGGGALFDFSCYDADLMTWLMDGRRPLAVTATTQQIKRDVYPLVDDEATIILTCPNAQAILQASWNWPFDRRDMDIYGRTGYVVTVRSDEIRVRRAAQEQEQQRAAAPIPPPFDDPISYLRVVVRDGLKPEGLSSLETKVIVTKILDAAPPFRRRAQNHRTKRLTQNQFADLPPAGTARHATRHSSLLLIFLRTDTGPAPARPLRRAAAARSYPPARASRNASVPPSAW